MKVVLLLSKVIHPKYIKAMKTTKKFKVLNNLPLPEGMPEKIPGYDKIYFLITLFQQLGYKI